MIFAARVDLWFLAVFYGFGIAMLVGAPFLRKRPRGPWASGLLIAVGLLFIGVAWRASAVQYLITADGFLDATGWPLNGRIAHVSEIQSVEPSHDARASHAASLDRLRVDYMRGSGVKGGAVTAGVIFIAVEEEAAFLDALGGKDGNLIRTPTGLRRLPEGRAIDIGAHPRRQRLNGTD